MSLRSRYNREVVRSVKLSDIRVYLGQPIRFSHYLVRRSSGVLKMWLPMNLPSMENGIIVGIRTLSNGRIEYQGDGVNEYTGREFFKVFLVATSLSSRIYKVTVDPKYVHQEPTT